MVMLHGDSGDIIGYDDPFPDIDMKRKEHIIEHFNEYEDAFFLAYTPTISSGMSINHSKFYKVYGSCTNMSNSPCAFVQQLNCVRDTVTNSYELFIKEDLVKGNYLFIPFPVKECREIIKFRKNVSIGKEMPWYNTMRSFLSNSVIDMMENNEYCYTTIVEEAYALALFEQLNTIGNFYQCILSVLGFHGIKCMVDGKELDHEINNNVMNAKMQCYRDIEHFTSVVNADDNTYEEFEK